MNYRRRFPFVNNNSTSNSGGDAVGNNCSTSFANRRPRNVPILSSIDVTDMLSGTGNKIMQPKYKFNIAATTTTTGKTPGTTTSNVGTTKVSDNSTGTINKSHTIVGMYEENIMSFILNNAAIVEGRGEARGEIGIAGMDVRYSELVLYQFVDSTAYNQLRLRLQILDPIEVC